MLLEQLVEKANTSPEYDWDAYYRWLFGTLAGKEIAGLRFWLCEHCFTVNVLYLPAKYGTCRGCSVTFIPSTRDRKPQTSDL